MSLADPLNRQMLALADAPGQALAQLHKAYDAGSDDPNFYVDIALWAGHFADSELAFAAAHKMADAGGGRMVYVWMPQLSSMRQLPEFKQYLKDIGMVAYWQEYGWPPFCRPLDQHHFECN